jgi:hypothetical protein
MATLMTLQPKISLSNQNTPPNPNNQLVPYNPGDAGRMQGDHSNGTWNDEQQQNVPDSCGASMLRESPLQAMITDAHQAPTQTLTPIYCVNMQTGHGLLNCFCT